MNILGAGIIGAASYASSSLCAGACDFKLAALKKKYALLIRGVHTNVHTVQKIAIVAIALFSGIATASLCPVAFSLIAKVGVGCIGGLVLGVIPAALAANPAFKVTEEEREAWFTRFVSNASTEELAELQGLPLVTGNLAYVKRILDKRVPIDGYYIFYQSLDQSLKTGSEQQALRQAFFKAVVQQGARELTEFLNGSEFLDGFFTGLPNKLDYFDCILHQIDLRTIELEKRIELVDVLIPHLPDNTPSDHSLFKYYKEFFRQAHYAGKIHWVEGSNPGQYFLVRP